MLSILGTNKSMKAKKITLSILMVAGLGIVTRFLYLANLSQSMTPSLGVIGNKLKPCLSDKNCKKGSLSINLTSDSGKGILRRLAKAFEENNLKAVTVSENYLHFVEQSSLFGFIDDIEVYLDQNKKVQLRSSSRVGTTDLGANEKRLNKYLKVINY